MCQRIYVCPAFAWLWVVVLSAMLWWPIALHRPRKRQLPVRCFVTNGEATNFWSLGSFGACSFFRWLPFRWRSGARLSAGILGLESSCPSCPSTCHNVKANTPCPIYVISVVLPQPCGSYSVWLWLSRTPHRRIKNAPIQLNILCITTCSLITIIIASFALPRMSNVPFDFYI